MRLTFVGDIALGDHPKAVGFGFRSRYAGGIPAAYGERLLPPGETTDVLFGNLEFTLGDEPGAVTDLRRAQCRGSRDYAAFLTSAGVTALNVANNHSTQAGDDAFESTIALLRASGIHVVGTAQDFGESGTIEVGGTRIAFLGWSDRPRQYAPHAALESIAAARRRADVVIVSMHWGDEFILVPSDRERAVARAMIDAGATCVIGHHPHVVREVERYKGGVIAYSLGNFICDMTWDERTRMSGWLFVDVEAARVTSSEFVPAVIDDDYFPRALSDRSGDQRLVRLAAARAADASAVARDGYPRAAEKRRKRHAAQTGLMMLRSLHRYRPDIAVEVIRGALKHRLQALFSPRPLSNSL
jgi:poly-gamma-glutamate capsule biosynthesis protein CapA/YwtB (metallophosphatase superfamily)